MKIYADLHTHTTYSCGKRGYKHASGTVLLNALAAKQKNIAQIAITEHGFSHKLYGVQKDKISQIRKEILEAKKETGVDILFGIEANIISADGAIDLTNEEMKMFDFVIVGFHKTARAKTLKDFFTFFLPNILNIKTKLIRKKNTNALCLCMQQYDVDLISHPQSRFALNMKTVTDCCIKTDTALELNGRRICYTKNDVALLQKSNVLLYANSDAHSEENVGNLNYPLTFAVRNNLNLQNIINFNRTVKLKNRKA